ncbi:murein L,D-transpeptidase [Methylosinus sp. H3A]|uniref:L,D-transpeptidase family protein n=1 Tax=Methylosinus sp. H3A TaxID=2785786 RepID=UPI0018C29774|nr:murein L,D-transpeptidase family protein [Methylosinus sp. H3A]MBG0810309.1 murein L,D-transpeptidase [Methylosinus sp. H3A]
MTSKPSRPVLLATALVLSLVEIGALVAFASRGPARRVEPTLAARSNPFGALLQNLRGAIVETAQREEPSPPDEPPPVIAAPIAPPALPPSFLAALPPIRSPEAELPIALPPGAAPLPPARPRNLVVEPSTTPLPPVTVTPPPEPVAMPALALAAAAPANELPPLTRRDDGNFRMGAAVYVRIFKKEGELELWRKQDGRYSLYRTYPICKWSGHLGPKLKSGDYQSPEGFYSVSARQLNPNSHYHRAFDVGFPNAFDRQNGRTGGALMVHGACKSVGCFAMTDKVIEEIYGMVEAALRGGQHEVPVHIFPFRMTETAFAKETQGDWTNFWSVPPEHQLWSGFWRNLKEGYDLFEQTGEPPTAYACGSRYAFGPSGGSCRRIAGW